MKEGPYRSSIFSAVCIKMTTNVWDSDDDIGSDVYDIVYINFCVFP